MDAAQQVKAAMTGVAYRPSDALPALLVAERSCQAVQATLANPPGTAPSASGIVRRIDTMLDEARLSLSPTPTLPTTPSSPGSGWGYRPEQLLEQTTAMSRAVDSLTQMLTGQAYQNYAYNVVLRDLDTLAARTDAFEQAIRRGTPRDRLAGEAQGLATLPTGSAHSS